jgi:hypothetical protein
MLKFPPNKIECALFIGIEAEGRFKGKKTLFVVGNVPYNQIEETMIKHPSIEHIYFGAGGTFEYNADTVISVFTHFISKTIAIESPVFDFNLYLLMKAYADKYNRAFTFIIPIVWAGIARPDLTGNMSHILFNPILDTEDRITIKLDTSAGVYLVPLAAIIANRLDVYDEDKLLWQKER